MARPAPPFERLQAEIAACRICRNTPQGKPLPHEPKPVFRISPTARICIAGQAAGTLAHESGTPFTDPSGERLRAWLGTSEAEFYDKARIAIVPMGFCFPGLDARGSDLPPRRECAPAWRARVFADMPQIELLLVIGQYAQRWHLGPLRQASLTATVADWQNIWSAGKNPRVLPLPHPSWRNNAWLKRHPWFETDVLPVLRAEVRRLLD
ncbi:MAG TPA: uracil-DNA glycosylase family protein [Afifellaceae bacterium]|nr:uracil-DNA glycosylase family protein [Afifellaceae bacterium]